MSSLLTPPPSPSVKEAKLELPYQSVIDSCRNLLQRIVTATVTLQTWVPFYARNQNQRLRPTAYLDGLRGFAAVLVYIMHHQIWAHESIHGDRIFENAFGYEGRYYFAALPGIKLFFAGGHFSVAIFFVISGYVLAVKPMKYLRDREFGKLSDSIGSAMFRRWIRLYMPIFATTLIYMTLAFLIQGLETNIKPEVNYFAELHKWFVECKNFSFVFRNGGLPWMTYNFHAWTIPLEYKGSLIVYASILAFAKCTRKARIAIQIFLMFYFMYLVDGWYGSCFVAGMLLVDLDLMAERDQLPSFVTNLEKHKTAIFYSLFVVAIYLGGVPCYGLDIANIRDAFGWHYLSYLRPSAVFMPKSFYLSWAGLFLVASVPRIGWLKSFFEHPVNQYFGKVSYAFYLIHGPILWTIGDRLYAAVGWIRQDNYINIPGWIGAFRLPQWGPTGLEVNFLAAQLILFPLTLWAAKLATDAFDTPSIKLAQWLYDRVRVKEEDTEKFPV